MREWILNRTSKWKQSIAIQSVFLNLVYLFGIQLFWRPFLASDDFFMSNIVYGVSKNDYDYQVTFMNFIYGRWIVFLMRLFPKVPWYTISFYFLIFMALTLFTYMILKWNDSYAGLLLANILLLYFSYEGYVSIHFTKVAGIVGGAALFALLSDNAYDGKRLWRRKLAGLALLFAACLVRIDCAKMVIGGWCLVFVWEVCEHLWKKQKVSLRYFTIKTGWLFFGVCIFFTTPKLSWMGMSEEERVVWTQFWQYNRVRSAIQDYPEIVDYQKNKEVYDAIGISENDLYIYENWNWDRAAVTLEQGEIILAIRNKDDARVQELLAAYLSKEKESKTKESESKEKQLRLAAMPVWPVWHNLVSMAKKVFDLNTMRGFFKLFPKSFLEIDVFIAYFTIIMFVSICWNIRLRDWGKAVIVSAGMLLLLNYYLYMNGRYLQHRVDVGLILIVTVVFLHFIMKQTYPLNDKIKSGAVFVGIISLSMLSGKYFFWWEDNPINQHIHECNKMFYAETSVDAIHDYFIARSRKQGCLSQVCYDAYTVPQVGTMQNILINSWPDFFYKSGPFVNIIDNEEKYLVMLNGDNNESAWQKYFTEHVGGKSDVSLVQVKQYLERKVYRVRSKPAKETVDLPAQMLISGMEVENLESIVSDKRLTVSGTAYLAGNSGFGQESYLQIVDSQSGEYELYDMLAACDETKKYGEDGYFAKLFADIELPEFYDNGDKVNIIIEQNEKFYLEQIQ